MRRIVIASILHGAYGDSYEQAICLKHYMQQHPELELRLFASTLIRLEAFDCLDLSFAKSFQLWTEIPSHPDIERFFQFQVLDVELIADVIEKLPSEAATKIDREANYLPWLYLRDHHLVPTPPDLQLPLSPTGECKRAEVLAYHGISPEVWEKPVVSFLWRYRGTVRGQAISNFGQSSEQELVASYSSMFRKLFKETDCHLLVFGMNVVMSDANRARLDNKYPAFGLELPAERVTYMQGLNWPVELEIAGAADVCCGNASGFTEALWLKRGRDMVLMDAPYHYLAKIAFRRMPMFDLDHLSELLRAFLFRSPRQYYSWIRRAL